MAKLTNEQKRLRGTAQPCRMSAEIERQTVLAIPEVRLKGTAKKIYAVTASTLFHQGILEASSLDMLVAYCREMALYHDLSKELEREGLTIEVETKFGIQTQINPKRKIAETALSAAKAISAEFGFTPISRSRIASLVAPKSERDDFAEYEEVK